MKKILFLLLVFMVVGCGSNNNVYWCGDQPCINKKEREAYFKKTMIVEIKDFKNKNEDNSEINKIIQQAQLSKKKLIKSKKELSRQSKMKEKQRIKDEKKLAKQIRLKEKKRIKEEKELAKQIRLEENKRIKNEKKSSKRKININQNKQLKKSVKLESNNQKIKIEKNIFSEFVKKITDKNSLKPYPDINDMPN